MSPYHAWARLGRVNDLLPWGGRLFGHGGEHAGYEIVDPRETLTAALVADGSIVLADPPIAPAPVEPAPAAPAPAAPEPAAANPAA